MPIAVSRTTHEPFAPEGPSIPGLSTENTTEPNGKAVGLTHTTLYMANGPGASVFGTTPLDMKTSRSPDI
ncbi:hypothetical protein VM1G_11342 [Cytospora mali]|uniref:Uncharacterized protein n=1 Tax=Cytospora mali TaxID=578113 RepID=A0A194VMV4_CYTMA|nr:hypothetical protein VM1G_11342 [Valsa mali]